MKADKKAGRKAGRKAGNYLKFGLMMIVSFVIMYAVMFLNVARFDHVYLSVTRFYMTLLMIAPMAIVMLLFMKGMYPNKKLNLAIGGASALVFVLALIFLRTQAFIGESEYMKAMIPHHSSAILTSREAELRDAEVQRLAREIIQAQEKEIDLMKRLLANAERRQSEQ